ncbi:YkvA family protein [Citreimonas sp.]|uniref:YkvA family protein n=1 Tax=Citreimonas sp. TaxID=3036715 RepID=UPI0035C87529
MRARLSAWALRLKRDVTALWLATRDPRVPRLARIVAATTVAYALSPIDLIPDPIPVIGQLDDILIVPLGLVVAAWLIPDDVMRDLRRRAETLPPPRGGWVAAALVVAAWLALALWVYTAFA